MSDTLTRSSNFRPSWEAPLLRSGDMPLKTQASYPMRRLLAAAAINIAMCNTPTFVSTSTTSEPAILSAEPQGSNHASPAALTRKSIELRIEGFLCAFNEAVELSSAMVAEDEGIPPNVQTWSYAAQTLCPLVTVLDLPPPMMLPLQNGGIGAEWHDNGLNIELRFRSPYQVYVVVEDARDIIATLHDFDLNLAHARVALRELANRRAA